MAEEIKLHDLNIYQRLAKIRKPVEVIKKNKKGYGYTYVNEEMILSKITGLMEKYAVSLIPGIVPGTARADQHKYSKLKTDRAGNAFEEPISEMVVQGDMEWKWLCNDKPEDCIIIPWYFVGSQSDASQSFGSALTYATRYFLLKYFNVATSDDDPDEYRRRQAEAEAEEDRLVAEKIINKVHNKVQEYLAKKPEARADIMAITKKYAKDKGKASANYFVIEDSATAAELSKALDAEIFNKEVK